MLEPSAIRRGAGLTYQKAAQPATFLVLVSGALRMTEALLAEWESCGHRFQLQSMAWKQKAIAYKARLVFERDAARGVIDHAAAGSLDWQAATAKASSYAEALNRFLNGPNADSGGWAELANELEELGCEPTATEAFNDALKSAGEGAKWLNRLLFPWAAATTEAIEYVAKSGGDLKKMAVDTKDAVETYWEKPLEYLYKGASSLATVVLVGLGLWFGWPIVAPVVGALLGSKEGK